MKYLLSQLYALLVRIRILFYKRGILHTRALRQPVISVGNLTTGGTGKTPFVAHLAGILKEAGYQPAILSRGYKGKAENSILLVSDGNQILCEPEDCGDEPYWLARKLKGVPLAVGKDRYRAGRCIERKYERVIHILDDGHQHLQLRRNLNILLLDATNPFGGYNLLPKGQLREPLDAIQRADLIVVTRSHLLDNEDEVQLAIRARNQIVPIVYFYHDGTALSDLKSGRVFPLRAFLQKRVIALAAIANPELFLRDLAHYQIRVVDRSLFRDHHRFTQAQLDEVLSRLSHTGAEAIVTTEKDAVRLQKLRFNEDQIFLFHIQLKAEDPKEFRQFILNELESMVALRPEDQGSSFVSSQV